MSMYLYDIKNYEECVLVCLNNVELIKYTANDIYGCIMNMNPNRMLCDVHWILSVDISARKSERKQSSSTQNYSNAQSKRMIKI